MFTCSCVAGAPVCLCRECLCKVEDIFGYHHKKHYPSPSKKSLRIFPIRLDCQPNRPQRVSCLCFPTGGTFQHIQNPHICSEDRTQILMLSSHLLTEPSPRPKKKIDKIKVRGPGGNNRQPRNSVLLSIVFVFTPDNTNAIDLHNSLQRLGGGGQKPKQNSRWRIFHVILSQLQHLCVMLLLTQGPPKDTY